MFVILSFSGDNDRDVFNEKPSKEELMSATQVHGSFTIICVCLYGTETVYITPLRTLL